jgi:hypothetical protein
MMNIWNKNTGPDIKAKIIIQYKYLEDLSDKWHDNVLILYSAF